MSHLRILYISNEIDPFLDTNPTKTNSIAKLVRNLAKSARSKDAEVRVLVPKYGIINDRKNKLHEVVRLSGINIKIQEDNRPLIIKVASIREERIQVYFIDNEEYYKRKSIFKDKNGNFHKDNSERLFFFSKGILETIKQLEWSPNIIHCNGWISFLIPMYIKTYYKNDPTFKDSKCIFSIYEEDFDENLLNDFLLKQEPELSKTIKKLNFNSILKLGANYADVVTNSNSKKTYPKDIENIKYIPIEDTDKFVNETEELYQNLSEIPTRV